MVAPPTTEMSPPPAHDPARMVPHAVRWSAEWWWRQARKLVVAVIGTTVVLIGIVMIVAPGPATIVIPIGLAILGTEFVWAKRLLRSAKRHIQELTQGSSPPDPPTAPLRFQMPNLHRYAPTTKIDLLRRFAVRFGCCTVPYLALAWSWSFVYGDDRFFRGFLWGLIVLIPGFGLALDLWRLKKTRDSENADA